MPRPASTSATVPNVPSRTGHETTAAHRDVPDLIHRADVADRLILVDAANRGRDRCLERQRVHAAAHAQHQSVDWALFVGHVDAGGTVVGRPADLFVADDADDFPRDIRSQLGLARDDLLDQDALADRILVGEESFREALVHHEHRR